jgi:hypothetical protein
MQAEEIGIGTRGIIEFDPIRGVAELVYLVGPVIFVGVVGENFVEIYVALGKH